ncbi:MAG: hypothetical protein WAN36_12500 [Calditrichia bacterium]
MIPIKYQNIQMGALSADKAFQSLKHQPQNHQRVFVEEVQKQFEEAGKRTESAEKAEKNHIEDQQKQNPQQEENSHKNRQEPDEKSDSRGRDMSFIEKKGNGTIKHFNVKI